jgi:Spy/CpxP family protein refolding chaperone
MGLGTGAALAQDAATTPQDTPPAGQEMHRGHGPMSTEQQLAHMTKALNLTADQQTQIKPLLDARRQQMMQMHEDKSLTREDRMTKFKALDDDTHAKIAAVLNDTQKAKFAKMEERRDEHMEQHSGGGMGAGQPQS